MRKALIFPQSPNKRNIRAITTNHHGGGRYGHYIGLSPENQE